MKLLVGLAVLLACAPSDPARASGAVKLGPNAKLSFEFSDLPETYYSQSTHEKLPAKLTAQLPENYTAHRKFPLFVFLEGGVGGRGDSTLARALAGPRDFITVSMPLFREEDGPSSIRVLGIPVNTGGMITANDSPVLGRAYKAMLQKLLAAIPNVTPERSIFGGFSNGAHATGALLAARDPFIMEHFTAFCLFEGGMALGMDSSALDNPTLKSCRYILFMGDTDEDPKLRFQRHFIAMPMIHKIQQRAAVRKIDFTLVIMNGYGDSMPTEYQNVLSHWVRGELAPQIPAGSMND